jgi:CHASE2 domain-containing sensor protein/class 3 adenylate cyclase
MAAEPITMVFTDLVASTELKNHLPGGDITARNQYYWEHILLPHRQRVERTLPDYGGRVVKTEGDGYFLVFKEALAAAKWAIALQVDHVTHPIATPRGPLQVKIGIHTGSPLADGNDYIGQEVDYAARLVGLAQGERTLLSEMTAVLVRSAQIQHFELYFQGDYTLRGLGAVPVYELVYRRENLQVPQRGPLGYEQARRAAAQRRRYCWYQILCTAIATLLFLGMQWLGWLQPWELQAWDRLMQFRPPESPDTRLLVVKVTEADVGMIGEYPLSDRIVLELLQALDAHRPKLIGLDLYRNIPVGAGRADLVDYWRQHPHIYGICKGANEDGSSGIAPPPELAIEQMGFADVVIDADQTVRRQLLFQTPHPTSPCTADYGLGTILAMHYLAELGETIAFTETEELQLGDRVVPRLQPHQGPYHRFDAAGYQMLLNYRLPLEALPQVNLNDVLTGAVNPKDIEDHIVLVGVDQDGIDRHFIPGGLAQRLVQTVPGVLIQAQMVSQLISGVVDGRPWLYTPPFWLSSLWVLGYTGLTTVLLGRWQTQRRWVWGLKFLGLVLLLGGVCLGALALGVWLPWVPTMLAIMLASLGLLTLPLLDFSSSQSS